MSTQTPVILYAEDSEDDVFLMERVLERIGFPGTLVVVPHGLEAIDYLNGTGSYGDRSQHPLPHVILLDVKVPRIGGLETLRWIRRQESLHAIPVLMLSSSKQPSDVEAAYAARADGYLVKPMETRKFAELMEDVVQLCGRTRDEIDPRRIRGAVLPPDQDRAADTSS